VFELALTETVVYPELPHRRLRVCHDHDEPGHIESEDFGPEPDYWFSNGLWPGCEGSTVIYTALLRTCRRVYLETAHLPSWNRELCYALHTEPPWAATRSQWTYLTPPYLHLPFTTPIYAARRIQRFRWLVTPAFLRAGLTEFLQESDFCRPGSSPSTRAPAVRVFYNIRYRML
jgi:hypothetical protein